jgi:hypothetical protein
MADFSQDVVLLFTNFFIFMMYHVCIIYSDILNKKDFISKKKANSTPSYVPIDVNMVNNLRRLNKSIKTYRGGIYLLYSISIP